MTEPTLTENVYQKRKGKICKSYILVLSIKKTFEMAKITGYGFVALEHRGLSITGFDM